MTGIFNQGSELTENIKWIGQGFPARLLLSEGMCGFEAYRCLTLHMAFRPVYKGMRKE